MTTAAPLLLNLADAAAQLGGVSVRTVRRLIEAGQLAYSHHYFGGFPS